MRVVDRHQKKAERVGVAPPAPPHADRGEAKGAVARLLGRGRKAKEARTAGGGKGAARSASVGSGGSVLARGVLPLSDAVTTLLQVGVGECGEREVEIVGEAGKTGSRGGWYGTVVWVLELPQCGHEAVAGARGGGWGQGGDRQGFWGEGGGLPLSDAVTTLLQVGGWEWGV